MARRKRASMREGPLADLFRSTIGEPADPPEAPSPGERHEEEADDRGTPGREADEGQDPGIHAEVPEPQPEPTGPEPTPEPVPMPEPEPEPVAPAAEPRI